MALQSTLPSTNSKAVSGKLGLSRQLCEAHAISRPSLKLEMVAVAVEAADRKLFTDPLAIPPI